MMKQRLHSNGSILLYVLMILSLVVMLMQQMMRGVFVGSHFTRTMIDREQAEMLALSGVNIAMAQLIYDEQDDVQVEAAQQQNADQKNIKGTKGFLKRVIPYLNRWQEFEFKEKIDGFDGFIQTCITCESGKININEAFDFKKMEFKKPFDILLKQLEMPGKIPAGEMVTRLTEFFKKRRRKLDDISELLAVPGFRVLDIMYKPPRKAEKNKKGNPNTDLALSDIFTTWTESNALDLPLLSDGVCAILGLRRPFADDPIIRKNQYEQFVQSFKKEMAQDWDAHWKLLENLYDQKPKIFPDIKNVFAKVFGPKVFSVLSCGKVGQVEQLMLAIIREELSEDDPAEDKKTGDNKQEQQSGDPSGQEKQKKKFRILRVYWL